MSFNKGVIFEGERRGWKKGKSEIEREELFLNRVLISNLPCERRKFLAILNATICLLSPILSAPRVIFLKRSLRKLLLIKLEDLGFESKLAM